MDRAATFLKPGSKHWAVWGGGEWGYGPCPGLGPGSCSGSGPGQLCDGAG